MDYVYFCTSRGYFIPFRLCSEPSDVALQRPQWKVILATRNLELSPPPLTKNSPSTLMDTKTNTHLRFKVHINLYVVTEQKCFPWCFEMKCFEMKFI